MTDIRTMMDDTRFDVRACGLLLDGDRFLISTEKDGTRTLPGGAVKVGETTEAAVIREFYEETNLQVQPRRLLAIIENHFKLKRQLYQQIIFVYELIKSNNGPLVQKEAVLAQ
jgi:8-oxo-dGTP diphosphatase